MTCLDDECPAGNVPSQRWRDVRRVGHGLTFPSLVFVRAVLDQVGANAPLVTIGFDQGIHVRPVHFDVEPETERQDTFVVKCNQTLLHFSRQYHTKVGCNQKSKYEIIVLVYHEKLMTCMVLISNR